ncbi:winged helix-turn-helix transcriptional regulator [archaeon]|nr:winged helix-turn-helix transcriptional regulator [archaeon]
MNKKESETLELKKSTSELKEAIISISSILNKHQKGKVYFGIRNDGAVIGQRVSEQTIRDISKSISDHIEPKIYPKINLVVLQEKDCIFVQFQGTNVPYYAYGRTYMRVGDEDKKLSAKEIENLILQKNKDKLVWDNQVNEKFSLDDISKDKLKSYVEDASLKYTSKNEVLEKLELIKDGILTNASIVLFGVVPSKYFSLLNLRCATFLGENKASTPLDMTDFNGDIFELMIRAENYILQHINVGMRLEGLYRVDVPEINKDAFREAIINAFCHRDYSIPQEINIAVFNNRVEILNPGSLYEGLTINDILSKKISKRRNSLIANIFHRVHLVEKWGTGIEKINSLEPTVIFDSFLGFFSTTFKRNNVVSKTVEKTVDMSDQKSRQKSDQKIIELISQNPKITISELMQNLNFSASGVKKIIKQLKEKGKLKRIGSDKGGHWEVV